MNPTTTQFAELAILLASSSCLDDWRDAGTLVWFEWLVIHPLQLERKIIQEVTMRYRLLMLTSLSLIVAALTMPVNAQQGTGGSTKMQEGPQTQQQTDQARSVHYRDDDDRGDWHRRGMMRDRHDDDDDCYGRGMMRGGRGDWHRREMMRGWRGRMDQGGGGAETGPAGMMGPGGMPMMRMMMVLADTDNDGYVSLQEFQAVHERVFRAMDADKNGRLTMDELQGFMAAPRSPTQQQQ